MLLICRNFLRVPVKTFRRFSLYINLETCQITAVCLIKHFKCHWFNSAISETFQFTKNNSCTPCVPMFLCSRTRSPRPWDVIRGNSCIWLHLSCWIDLVPVATENSVQSYPVEYYLKSVEEYSEGKIHKSEPKPGNGHVNTVYFVIQARGNTRISRTAFVYNEGARNCKCLLILELPA